MHILIHKHALRISTSYLSSLLDVYKQVFTHLRGCVHRRTLEYVSFTMLVYKSNCTILQNSLIDVLRQLREKILTSDRLTRPLSFLVLRARLKTLHN